MPCIGLYTPNGHKRLELPNHNDMWVAIDRYDRKHGTNIYDLYDVDTVETDDRIAREFPPYDPSDEEYTLTGEKIADLAWVFYPSEYWLFDNCAVKLIDEGFAVYMQGEDGGIVRQNVISEDVEAGCRALNEGYAPPDGWEDGMGNSVCPSNGVPVMSTAEVVHGLRKNPLDGRRKPSKNKAKTTKTSANRKSGSLSGNCKAKGKSKSRKSNRSSNRKPKTSLLGKLTKRRH